MGAENAVKHVATVFAFGDGLDRVAGESWRKSASNSSS